ncbi:hypothetical protein [Actinocorallia populi]|uniref:hypothetical protein n=1 Tax=Actinocorallia populi TaxID=2079200 RepID=UPI0013004D37|nr:hypothetical protein [Actinocorallia populi]
MTDEQPVFVDGTGKRRKLFQVAGVISGVVIAGYAIALGVSLGTGTEVPLTTWVVPEKKTRSAENAKLRRKTVVPSAVPQPSVPVYVPPVVSPSASVTPTETPTQTQAPRPTKTATSRPTVITKSPKPTPSTPTETASPSPSATPTATPQPPGETDPGVPPAEPPVQEKKTAEE